MERQELEGMGLAGWVQEAGRGAGKRRRVREEMFDGGILEIRRNMVPGKLP